MSLAQAILAGRITVDNESADALLQRFAYCLGCGLCEQDCPSEVQTRHVVEQMRGLLQRRTGQTLRDRVLTLLATPLPRVLQPLAWLGSTAGSTRVARAFLEAAIGIDHEAPVFSFSPGTLRLAFEAPAFDAVYFPDTFAAVCEPTLGSLCLDLIRRAGLTPWTSPFLAACTPALARGDGATAARAARTVARLLRDRLKPRMPLIFSEPTALQTVAHDFPRLLGSGEPGSTLLAASAVDLVQLLLQRFEDGLLDRPTHPPLELGTIVYHRACHVRGSASDGAAVALLRKFGYEVEQLPTSCCGMSGTFGLKAAYPGYSVSREVGAPVFSAIRETRAAVVLSECSACRLQLAANSGARALHPLVLVAARYGTR